MSRAPQVEHLLPRGNAGPWWKALLHPYTLLGASTVRLLCTVYLLFVDPAPPRKIILATGNENGAYYAFGKKYEAEFRRYGVELEVRSTHGSAENLALLRSGAVQAAFVQGGVETNPQPAGEHLVALGSLYREPMWVFAHTSNKVKSLRDLKGRRIGIGPEGSGSQVVALQMLEANGVVKRVNEKWSAPETTLDNSAIAVAVRKLQANELDAVIFVAAIETSYVEQLFRDPTIDLLSFPEQEAYLRRYRYLSGVTVPRGLIDLGTPLPSEDKKLLAPTATLVVCKDLHPALMTLLLQVATKVHADGDQLSKPGEFPSAQFTDLPVAEEATHYYKSGPPFLQNYLPFWLASWLDRLKIMLIPLVMLLMPVIRMAPPLVAWRTRRKILTWYRLLRHMDQRILVGLTADELRKEIARLREIELQMAYVEVPLAYMEEFYTMRLHMLTVQNKLERLLSERPTSC